MAKSAEKTLLLVEDEAIVAIAEKKTLERLGYSVVTASSGEKAVETVEATADIDLVLMDIDLGSGMDGTEAAKRILSRHELPIVFLSSHTEPEFVERTEGITSYGYIVKNSVDTVLDTSIKMAFKLFEAHREAAEQSRRVRSRNEELRVKNEKLAWWHELMDYVVQHDLSAVAVLDNTLRFLYVSERFLSDYRIDEPEVVGKYHHEVFPDASKEWRASHERALNGEVVSSDTDYFKHADGTVDYIRSQCRPWYDAAGAIGGIVVYTEVLTEQIQAQEALKDRQALFEQAEQLAHIGNWELDLRQNKLTWSDEVYRIFGLEPQEFPATYEAFLERVHPEDRDAVDEAYSRSLREGEYHYQIEHRVVRAHTGEVRYVFETGTHERASDGTLIRSIGMVQDVTERKRLEERQAQQELRARWLSEIARRVLSGASVQQIIEYTVNELSTHFPALRVAYSTVDSEGVLRTLSSVEPEGMPNLEGLEADLNRAPDYLWALRGDEPVLVSDVNEDPRLEAIRSALAAGNTRAMLDVPLTHSKGLVGLLCFDASSPRRWAEHEEAILQEIADYLTLAIQNDRSKTALQQSEERFRTIVTHAQIGIVTVSAQETILEANPFFRDWLGYSEQELKQLTIGDITHDEDHEDEKVLMGRLQRGELDAARMEKRYIRKSGEIVWGDMVTNVIEGQEENDRFGLGLVVDITERKKDDERIRQLLREKDIVLSEVHHRIKNDMAMISGLLMLQAESAGSREVASALEEAQLRISVMKSSYEQLYEQQSVEAVNLKAFIGNLVSELQRSYGASRSVRLVEDVSNIDISARLAFPLGIIVNELLTNAFKYAFSDDRATEKGGAAEIRIAVDQDVDQEVEQHNGGTIVLTVSDNGRGMPPEVLENETAFSGMTLVRELSKQFNGSLEVENNTGTVVRVVLQQPEG